VGTLLSQVIPTQISVPSLLKIQFNIVLLSVVLRSSFLIMVFYAFVAHFVCAACLTCLTFLKMMMLIVFGEEYRA